MPNTKTNLHILKFGGSSVQNAEALRLVQNIVTELAASEKIVVVVSAMGGITDLLLKSAHQAAAGETYLDLVQHFHERHHTLATEMIGTGSKLTQTLEIVRDASSELQLICQSLAVLKEKTPRILDLIVSRGERTLAQIFAAALINQAYQAEYIDAYDMIVGERQSGSIFPNLAKTRLLSREKLLPLLDAGKIGIVPGFIGQGPEKELITLGRGGSDLTATVLAHTLSADKVTLYKEVDGLLTADPRYVPEARVVPELHFREAAELAYYGAKILHPRAMIPLLDSKTPLFLKNTFRPKEKGTRIASDVSPGFFPVKALTAAFQQSLLTLEGKGMLGVPGIASRAFQALAQGGISVSVISQASSEASICMVIHDHDAKAAKEALEACFQFEIHHALIEGIGIKSGLSVLAVVGLGMKGTPGIAARTFAALAKAEVNIEAIAQGSSELNISVVITEAKAKAALVSLHREFRLEKLHILPTATEHTTHIAIHGLGQIGRSLAQQLLLQKTYFQEKMKLELKCLAVSDSGGMYLNPEGIPPHFLQEIISRKERGLKIQDTLQEKKGLDQLWSFSLARGVFIDLTAKESFYDILSALEAGWHVVVANKKPLAVKQDLYDQLFATALHKGVYLRYEATVGAGLPILDTLAKLEEAGDEIEEISGCFSGTLGFLMTELENATPFKDAVALAHAKGYTEPDPREDLSGLDVARKALILARFLGMRLDLEDIEIESLYPKNLEYSNPKTFIESLSHFDHPWKSRLEHAARNQEVLRYVAKIRRDGIRVGIEAVARQSPLGQLRGTDNLVSLKTRRYQQNPLIVSGPGAGAGVTAAGVLNDILAIATSSSDASMPRKRR